MLDQAALAKIAHDVLDYLFCGWVPGAAYERLIAAEHPSPPLTPERLVGVDND